MKYSKKRLSDLQKLIDAQYFYWWMNDMKKEEYALELFEEKFPSYCTGAGDYDDTNLGWARNAKYVNSFLNSAHMGHQPLVWFMDDTHARGIFFFESNMNYLSDKVQHEHFFAYVNDFVKHDDGQWYISAYRLIQTKLHGTIRPETFGAPEGYVFPDWEEM